jgi:D-methionine transport system ATP-binding protein
MNSTVYENIAFPLKTSSYPKGQIEARVNELLEMVELQDKKNAYPSKLSGGQKQRVGIARALANNPSILLLDEATSALDPATTNSILELMKSINRKLGITIVVVTHEMDVIKKLCSRVAVIQEGSIVEEGRVIDVFSNPQTKTTNKFLHAENTEIPDWVDNSTDSRTIRIHFMGEETGKPYISNIIRDFNVTANIISGNIEIVQNVQIGRLVVNISGKSENIDNALKYLTSNNLRIEVFEDDSFKYI